MPDIILFDTEYSSKALELALNNIGSLRPSGDFEISRNQLICTILKRMRRDSDSWDLNCQGNIQSIGKQLFNYLQTPINELDKENLDMIFSSCFRFFLEYELTHGIDEFESQELLKFALSNSDGFSHHAAVQIDFATKSMPLVFVKKLAKNAELVNASKLESTLQRTEDAIQKSNDSLSQREERIEALSVKLEKYETAFNFVGLYQGFDNLAKEKHKERTSLVNWLIVFGVLLFSVLGLELFVIYHNVADIEKAKSALWMAMIPSISLTVVLVYFFRLILVNHKAVKSQLMQIELRKTLCQFIQNYAETTSDLKGKNLEAWSKFEAIIFSRIVSDDEKLPSAYDGMDQLSSLITKFKK
ncbi:hypothetical protein [Deefgea rivuli]|uniref:hypothetical protein n=1 Tax=Deefgea rivuli TaxID=400948 RepID=UPI00048168C6|nr:hypothetical protein [Deefgea rivuli]